MEVSNIEYFINDLKNLREKWDQLWNEATVVVSSLDAEVKLSKGRAAPSKTKTKRKRFHNETPVENVSEESESGYFKIHIFYVLIDSVIGGLTVRFDAAKSINDIFNCLWQYKELPEADLSDRAIASSRMYPSDLSEGIRQELNYLRSVHDGNFEEKSSLPPLKLLNKLYEFKLHSLFPNVCVALRIFLSMPATVATAERSFSKLKLVKSYLHTTMFQDRLVDLARLSIEHELANSFNFDNVIQNFARRKARKVHLI